ncbi:protein translocase subunit SecF [Patescibacteria group bacterium]|nr:protein translocase subunit SecF [Patescibacteria group bacterium]
MIKIIEKRKTWFIISGIMVLVSILVLILWGLNFGIDFTGGSLLEVSFYTEEVPSAESVVASLRTLEIGEVEVQPIGRENMILRFREVDENTHQSVMQSLKESFGAGIEERRFDSIGPSIGEELKKKSIWATLIVIIAIISYIAWVFRKVSKPVASWKYGIIAVIALMHDVIIVLGLFAILGKIYSVEIDTAFVAAILTILGYSVNDTIVVFDRTRENLAKHVEDEFEPTVERSVKEIITRSINTSFTTLIVLFSILIFGGSSIRNFVLALIFGVGIGTYSSIFLASPLLVVANKIFKK